MFSTKFIMLVPKLKLHAICDALYVYGCMYVNMYMGIFNMAEFFSGENTDVRA